MSFASQLFRTKSLAQTQDELHRTLGVFSLTLMGVGATVGTGIFFVMADTVPNAGPAVILSFILAAVTAGLTALCYTELSFRIPAAGSSYSYAYATVGEFPAYIVAFCLLLEYGLAGSATSIGWSDYLNNFLKNAFDWQVPEVLRTATVIKGDNGMEFHPGRINLPPLVLIAMCGFLLLRGVKESTAANSVMVLIKLSVLVFFACVAFSGFNPANLTPFFSPDAGDGLAKMQSVTAAAGTVFFTFVGLDTITTGGEEARNPTRTVPHAVLAALIIVFVFYMLVVIAAVGAQPAALFKGQEAGLAVILQNVTGKTWPALILSAGAVISVFSVTLVSIYGQTRILYAVSRDGLIPRGFQEIGARSKVPVKNTVIVCIVVALVAGFVDANYLWDMVSMGTLIAFTVISVAVPVLRRKRIGESSEGFRVPFGPYLIPALSIIACLYLVYGLSTLTYIVFAIWMAVAIICYFAYGLRHSRLNR